MIVSAPHLTRTTSPRVNVAHLCGFCWAVKRLHWGIQGHIVVRLSSSSDVCRRHSLDTRRNKTLLAGNAFWSNQRWKASGMKNCCETLGAIEREPSTSILVLTPPLTKFAQVRGQATADSGTVKSTRSGSSLVYEYGDCTPIEMSSDPLRAVDDCHIPPEPASSG